MPQRASSMLKILRRDQILSGGAGAHTESFLQNPLMVPSRYDVLVAALGNSGAVSGLMVDHVDGYPLRQVN